MQVKIKLLERIQDYYIPVTNLAEEQDGGERERDYKAKREEF